MLAAQQWRQRKYLKMRSVMAAAIEINNVINIIMKINSMVILTAINQPI